MLRPLTPTQRIVDLLIAIAFTLVFAVFYIGATLVPGARRGGGVSRIAVSPTRARIHLQWSPWTDLASGVRSTVATYAAS